MLPTIAALLPSPPPSCHPNAKDENPWQLEPYTLSRAAANANSPKLSRFVCCRKVSCVSNQNNTPRVPQLQASAASAIISCYLRTAGATIQKRPQECLCHLLFKSLLRRITFAPGTRYHPCPGTQLDCRQSSRGRSSHFFILHIQFLAAIQHF